MYTAVAEVTGGRDGHARIIDRPGIMEVSSPPAMGGSGTGFNPEQLFAVAFGGCFGAALDLEARQAGIALAEVTVTSYVSIGHGDGGHFALSIVLNVRLPGLDHLTAKRLVRDANLACPYSRMTRGHVEVELILEEPQAE
jgi:Ohr subfamily peroxiredoxin